MKVRKSAAKETEARVLALIQRLGYGVQETSLTAKALQSFCAANKKTLMHATKKQEVLEAIVDIYKQFDSVTWITADSPRIPGQQRTMRLALGLLHAPQAEPSDADDSSDESGSEVEEFR